jgi:flagellar biosynthetic protein FliQ
VNELIIIGIAKQALKTALMTAGPALIVSMIVGLSVSIFQVVTSLQDQTVAFVPKLVAVMATIVICFPYMMRLMVGFATHMFTDFNQVVKALN